MKSYRQYFVRAIRDRYPENADSLIFETDNHYKTTRIDTFFSKASGNPIDKRLDFSSYFLALIKTLDQRGESFETIRKICLEIVIEYVRPRNKFQQLLKQVPAKLTNTWLASIVIAYLIKKIKKRSHPDGFVVNIITDNRETFGLGYGFDILECGICKLFKKHNYGKYSSILAKLTRLLLAWPVLHL